MESDTYGATVTPLDENGNKVAPTSYNANLLVTYKVIRGYADAEYTTDKVSNIEYDLHNGRESEKRASTLTSQISTVKDIILEAYTDSDDQETLLAVAEALHIELTKDVEFTATVEVSGSITVSLVDSYDFESEVEENLYVDSQNGNIEISEQYVSNVRES